jgi:hypothetical protein
VGAHNIAEQPHSQFVRQTVLRHATDQLQAHHANFEVSARAQHPRRPSDTSLCGMPSCSLRLASLPPTRRFFSGRRSAANQDSPNMR